MNKIKEQEIQKILKGKYLLGPKFDMSDDLIGINYFSGSLESAYYELYGKSSIFRIIIMQPTANLFTTHFVGKNHVLFLLMEGEQVHGGFVSISDNIIEELNVILPHVREEHISELHSLWETFTYKHYQGLLKDY